MENNLKNINDDFKKFKKLLKTQGQITKNLEKLNKFRFDRWNMNNKICQMKFNIINNSYISINNTLCININ